MPHLVCPAYEEFGIPALYLHDLTGTAVVGRLLGVAAPVHPATETTLARLRQWNPDVGSQFSRKDAGRRTQSLKLITQSPTWTPDLTHSFVAVSYCWHGDDWDVSEMLLAEYKDRNWAFPVSPRMLRAVIDSRDYENEAIWIDQLCINQDDAQEKRIAIENMDTIYRNARELVILLEDIDIHDDYQEALRLLYEEKEFAKSSQLKPSNSLSYLHRYAWCSPAVPDVETSFGDFDYRLLKNLVKLLARVFEARWFSRAWCIQEYQLNANRTIVVAGRNTWISVQAEFLRHLRRSLFHFADESLKDYLDSDTISFFTFGSGVNTPLYVETISTFEVAWDLSRLQCSKMEDMISILFNITSLSLSFSGTVPGRSYLNWLMTLIALSSDHSLALASSGYFLDTDGARKSWIQWPEEATRLDTTFHSFMTKADRVEGIRRVDMDSITMDLIPLDGFLQTPDEGCFRRVSSFLNGPFRKRWDSSLYDYFNCLHLAASLSLGLPWILQAVESMGEPFEAFIDQYIDKYREPYQDMWETAISALLSADEKATIGRDKESYDQCHRFFALLFYANDFLFDQDVEVKTFHFGKRKAIIYLPPDLAEEISQGSFRLAVPLSLNTTEGMSLPRVWILLEYPEQESTFVLLGKAFMYGCGLLDCEDFGIMRNVRILGPRKPDVLD